jgi:hypothetical protein
VRRNLPGGVRNLGNTCYIGATIQVCYDFCVLMQLTQLVLKGVMKDLYTAAYSHCIAHVVSAGALLGGPGALEAQRAVLALPDHTAGD